jgi:hypothetical protein
MKPFDLEAARNGAKVQTRDGRHVKILTHDKAGTYPVVALVGEDEQVFAYTRTGQRHDGHDSPIDLVMTPEMCTVYINVYHDNHNAYVYSNREDADKCAASARVSCIKHIYEVE